MLAIDKIPHCFRFFVIRRVTSAMEPQWSDFWRRMENNTMQENHKPPGKKKEQPTNKHSERERSEPAAAERTDDRETAEPAADAGSPSREEVISNIARPVTNQDEQDKITNAGADDIPVPDK